MDSLRIEQLSFGGMGPVTLRVEPGECVCLRGPSGCGKSRLLRAVADLDPHEGTVYLGATEANGVDPPSWRRMVGLLPAESHWWASTVGEHFGGVAVSKSDDLSLAIPGRGTTTMVATPGAGAAAAATSSSAEDGGARPSVGDVVIARRELLARLGLAEEVLEWRVDRLSSGEKQRLALARLLSIAPKALLLDEPTANLDPENAERVERLIAEIRAERQIPVLWVTHDAAQAARVASRTIAMREGRLLEEAP